ncbi:hypothetical protein JHK85_015952 [Glycine max]|nr:hypothetical protein JHK85_015952 [Glycine max]
MAGKTQTHYFLLLFLFLISINAKLDLYPSDYKALLTLQKDLGVNGQVSATLACETEGVFCERRKLSGKETYALRITRLVFKSNNLNGVLSPSIGRLTELKELSLSDNNLFGRLPPQIFDCRKLQILDLANNLFSGPVPPELSSLTRLRVLDISTNRLSGNLNFLKYFPNLETLSVADNLFTGRVPPSVRSFRNLRQFNFSGNHFLEPSLQSSSPETILSRRFLLDGDGDVPAPAPAPAPNNSNKKKKSNASSGAAAAPGPAPNNHKHKKSRRKLLGWILGFVAGAVAGILAGFVFSLMFKLALALIKGRGRKAGPDIYSPLIKKAEDLAFLEKEEGMASLEIIGRGGCGEVYKAELPGSNGKMIAIKKIIQPPKEGAELAEEDSKVLNKKMRQIRSEITTVGQIRHRNLLPLLAHHTEEMSLVKWMRKILSSENPKEAIDTKLLGNGYEDQMLLVLKIACFCTMDDPKERPNSKDVWCMLSQIKH